ncbi:exosome complex exonuclease Rrp41 [Candidatus Pacearchaeota archaeon]|nr:exosome complex exonuclease Rrp41 [Candidatus Pacearchaeota archaeon]|tara:strand:- start:3749 stop:4480 length:732 start_codon:yes stop_codon:yes gene_type:complete
MAAKKVDSLYKKRSDGRKMDEIRPIAAKVGVVPSADGSAMFETGGTRAIAVVRGPRVLHPQNKRNPQKGILRVSYGMMPFSVWDRIRPGPSRRSEEISKVSEWALDAVVDLDAFPNTVVDVFIQIPQADAGTRVAGLNAAAMALAHAGIPMKEMVSAMAVGKADKTIIVDVDKDEEDFHDGEGATDIPMAITSRTKKITLLQLDGKISTEELKTAIEMGKKACGDVLEVQMKALKEANTEDKE